jgi:hypothetical protein
MWGVFFRSHCGFFYYYSLFSGLNRGAARFQPIAWREGHYNFHFTPLVEDHFRSGLALTSPDLHPPFAEQTGLLPGNQSALPCDPSLDMCLEDRNASLQQGWTMKHDCFPKCVHRQVALPIL